MNVPSWLAPNEVLAEPRVKRFAGKIASQLDESIKDFWAAVPCVRTAKNLSGDIWSEAVYCLVLDGYVPSELARFNERRTIAVEDWVYRDDLDETRITLSCRILN